VCHCLQAVPQRRGGFQRSACDKALSPELRNSLPPPSRARSHIIECSSSRIRCRGSGRKRASSLFGGRSAGAKASKARCFPGGKVSIVTMRSAPADSRRRSGLRRSRLPNRIFSEPRPAPLYAASSARERPFHRQVRGESASSGVGSEASRSNIIPTRNISTVPSKAKIGSTSARLQVNVVIAW